MKVTIKVMFWVKVSIRFSGRLRVRVNVHVRISSILASG